MSSDNGMSMHNDDDGKDHDDIPATDRDRLREAWQAWWDDIDPRVKTEDENELFDAIEATLNARAFQAVVLKEVAEKCADIAWDVEQIAGWKDSGQLLGIRLVALEQETRINALIGGKA